MVVSRALSGSVGERLQGLGIVVGSNHDLVREARDFCPSEGRKRGSAAFGLGTWTRDWGSFFFFFSILPWAGGRPIADWLDPRRARKAPAFW